MVPTSPGRSNVASAQASKFSSRQVSSGKRRSTNVSKKRWAKVDADATIKKVGKDAREAAFAAFAKYADRLQKEVGLAGEAVSAELLSVHAFFAAPEGQSLHCRQRAQQAVLACLSVAYIQICKRCMQGRIVQ